MVMVIQKGFEKDKKVTFEISLLEHIIQYKR